MVKGASVTIPCCGIPLPLRLTALTALVVQTTSAVILTRYSKLVVDSTTAPYHSPTLVVMAEFSKLLLSMLFVFLFDYDPHSEHSSNTSGSGKDGGEASTTTAQSQLKEGEKTAAAAATVGGSGGGGGEQQHTTAVDVMNASSSSSSEHMTRWQYFKHSIYKENFVSPLSTVKLAVPALLYTVQNNLIYVALANLEATTFQVGYQSKVITTAVLSVVMLNRKLSAQKWIALISLTLGIVMTQADGGREKSSGGGQEPDDGQNFFLGIVSVLICAFCSAFAGVYFEKILKGSNPSVWIRNTQLAFFSTLIGLVGVYGGPEGFSIHFFQGYNKIVWTIIFVQAVGGLIIAVVVKYADNILKGFATALSIVLCGACSAFLFGFVPTMTFLMGSMTVIGATFLYSAPEPASASSPQVPLPQHQQHAAAQHQQHQQQHYHQSPASGTALPAAGSGPTSSGFSPTVSPAGGAGSTTTFGSAVAPASLQQQQQHVYHHHHHNAAAGGNSTVKK